MKFLKKFKISEHKDLVHIISVLLLAASILTWVFLAVPYFEKLPKGFRYDANVVSTDNLYDLEKGDFGGEISSSTQFYYQFQDERDGVYLISNVFDVTTPQGEPIFTVERLYGIDPYTGEHVPGYGDQDRNGYLFAPKNLGKENFTYWHVNYNIPVDMSYVSEETILGLNTYNYISHFTVDQTENLDYLPGVPEEKGISVDVVLSIWIEPTTGHLIKYEDEAVAYFYDQKSGERVYPWNKFSNYFANSSVTKHVQEASNERFINIILEKFVSGILLLVLLSYISLLTLEKTGFKKIAYLNPILILVVGLTATALTWFVTKNIFDKQIQLQFESEVSNIQNSFETQMEIYTNVLRSGRGLFEASEEVTREEWANFISGLKLSKNYPGVQAMGYAPVIKAGELESFERNVQIEEFPDFQVYPEGNREKYTPVFFIEPFEGRNLKALGYDMYSEEVRRKTMDTATSEGTTSLSDKVQLIIEEETDIQAGFLMYLPIYKAGMPISTVEEKEEALQGFVYSPFRANNFIQKTLDISNYNIDFEIYDSSPEEGMTEENKIFDSNQYTVHTNKIYDPELTSVRTLNMYNNSWTIKFFAPQSYGVQKTNELLPFLSLIIGSIMSILLFAIVYTLSSSRKHALNYAVKVTRSLRAEKKHLASANAKDEAILKSIADGVIATDKKGKILFINKVAISTLQLNGKNYIGKNLLKVINMTYEGGEKIPASQRPVKLILSGKEQSMNSSKKYYVTREDGSRFPVAFSIAPVKIEGKTVGAIVIFRDITKEMEMDKAKTEFVSLASHQLRTPLTAIKWYSEMLLGKKNNMTKDQLNYLSQIGVSNQRMVELVDMLLNVSRIEMGTLKPERKSNNITSIIKNLLEELTPEIKKKKLKVSENYSEKIPSIISDENILRMIFQNLLTNAIKYTPDNGEIEVNVNTDDVKKNIIIRVKDSGYGIPKKQHGKIFSKLFRADNAREKVTDGTGLGLYIVKGAVDKLGGKVWFDSIENKGTQFYVSLPIKHV